MNGFWSLEHGIVDAEMIGGAIICVPDTHAEALDDFANSLSSFVVPLGLSGALNRAFEGPTFRSLSGFGALNMTLWTRR